MATVYAPANSSSAAPDDCTLWPHDDTPEQRETLLFPTTQGLKLDNDTPKPAPTLVLGIETTCDETAAAVVERQSDGSGRI
jgi:hypothetical protein